jgi:hypothetical protein
MAGIIQKMYVIKFSVQMQPDRKTCNKADEAVFAYLCAAGQR